MEVDSFQGLLIDYGQRLGARGIGTGLPGIAYLLDGHQHAFAAAVLLGAPAELERRRDPRAAAVLVTPRP